MSHADSTETHSGVKDNGDKGPTHLSVTAQDVDLQHVHESRSFGEPFLWDLLRGVLLGAIGGAFLVVVGESLKNKGRPINTFSHRLQYDPEGMETQIDLCELFYMLQQRFSKYNQEAYAKAFGHCTHLCTMAEEIAKGLLNGYLEEIKQGKMSAKSVTYDLSARELWYAISDELTALLESVREFQSEEFRLRDELDRDYNAQKEEYARLKAAWDDAVMTAKTADLDDDSAFDGSFASLRRKKNTTAIDKVPAAPVPPIAPPLVHKTLKVDEAERIVEKINVRTLQIFRYIQENVRVFRQQL